MWLCLTFLPAQIRLRNVPQGYLIWSLAYFKYCDVVYYHSSVADNGSGCHFFMAVCVCVFVLLRFIYVLAHIIPAAVVYSSI